MLLDEEYICATCGRIVSVLVEAEDYVGPIWVCEECWWYPEPDCVID